MSEIIVEERQPADSARQPVIVLPAETPHSLSVVGEQITVLASGAQTGSYEIFHQAGPEGSGPPPHSHDWDEAFYVITGEMAFGVAEREFVAAPGTLVHIPAGITHWFRFGNGGGSMLSMTSREGASHLFTALDREISSEQPDVEKLVKVAQEHGLTLGA